MPRPRRRNVVLVTLVLFAVGAAALASGRPAATASPRVVAVSARADSPAGRFAASDRARLGPSTSDPLPAGVERVAGLAYGPDPRQRFDVYHPSTRATAPRPVLVMVHGGGWRNGDKAIDSVWRNKVARWVPRGWIVVSVNYRLLPDAPPLEQAGDVAAAVARAQQRVSLWGGDPNRFVLMGHSAGAHLVALLDADPALATSRGVLPWRATVALDSAAYDVPRLMRAPHLPLYDDAFGRDPALWPLASPIDRLHPGGAPLLAVCSSLRRAACPQARAFALAARGTGLPVTVAEQPLTHAEINAQLGLPGAYTDVVDRFITDAVR